MHGVAGAGGYRAFISYSHADARFAGWLHRKLEAARDAGAAGSPRLAPVFIDRAELSAGEDLSAQVKAALEASAALVVVASPAAAASRWVAQEIELFRALHPGRPVLAALIDGEPAAAFPAALSELDGRRIEPLAADFRDGRDGKRLGLLKIVAGLTGQPLDRLVQRDAQARQRRVMAVTAAALLLSLILAALLVFALRARAEAERQRAEAEGMVEFMLTDLRDKLKGVGRLDVMDAVNQRAMEHYERQNLGALPDESLTRRARLLLAMGEDDLGRSDRKRLAFEKLTEAWRTTRASLHRDPADPTRVQAHGQSENLLGYAYFQSLTAGGVRDTIRAEPHWLNYLALARKATELRKSDPDYRKELAYAHGNLCALYLELGKRPSAAISACQQARVAMEEAIKLGGNGLANRLDLANRRGWEADALMAAKRPADALRVRGLQLNLITSEARVSRNDARVIEAQMLVHLGLASTYKKLDRLEEAREAARQAGFHMRRLRQIDPSNTDWSGWEKQISALESL